MTDRSLVGSQEDIYFCVNLNDPNSFLVEPLKLTVSWIDECSASSLTPFLVSDITEVYSTTHSLTVSVPTDTVGQTVGNPDDMCGTRTLELKDLGTNVAPLYATISSTNAL